MQVTIGTCVPKEWGTKKPVESYETTFLATGFSRYNTAKKTLSQFTTREDGIWYTESPCAATVFPRVYLSEAARVSVYSLNPRVWAEEVGIDMIHFFVQQPIQTA